MPRRNVVWILGFLGISVFAWAAAQGGFIPPKGPMQFVKGYSSDAKDYDNLALLIDVMQHVDMNYVRPLTPAERRNFMEAAIKAGLKSLDDHSAYANPKEYANFKKQSGGKFGGIGIQVVVNRDTKRVTIVSPIVGTPAFRAGIKPGDEIEAINGEKTSGLNNDEIVERISGSPGTTVSLTLRRRGSGRRIDLTLTREEIHTEGILGDKRKADQSWDYYADAANRIGYVRVVSFSESAFLEFAKVLKQLEQQDAQGLVIDLRNNPGGSLENAVAMCDLLLEEGVIVRVEGRTDEARIYHAKKEGTLFTGDRRIPITVLINGDSASASEIVSSALQDHGRAVIIGERSFGKGSVQRTYPLEGATSQLRLTTAKYLRPNGKNIHKFKDSKDSDDWGVRPDIEIKLSPGDELDWLIARRDRDIVRDEESSRLDQAEQAASVLGPLSMTPSLVGPMGMLSGLAETAATFPALPRSNKPYQDKVLDKALEYLREKIKVVKTS